MDVVLISFSICLLGVMVTVLLFSVAMRPQEENDEPQSSKKSPVPTEGFFLDEVADAGMEPNTTMNALVLQFEHHVRLEHEAAAAFLQGPSVESLHAPSESPLWN